MVGSGCFTDAEITGAILLEMMALYYLYDTGVGSFNKPDIPGDLHTNEG